MPSSTSTATTLRPVQRRQISDNNPPTSSIWHIDTTSNRQHTNPGFLPRRRAGSDVKDAPPPQLQLRDETNPSSADVNATFPRVKSELNPSFRKKSGELLKPSLRARTKSAPSTPGPKAVHFDQQLEQVRLFRPRQTPRAVSRDGSPTETSEGETSDGFPFPGPLRLKTPFVSLSPDAPWTFNVRIERLFLDSTRSSLLGTVIVRNIAYAKLVVARFTLDAWQTTSEVTARHIAPLRGGSFDRFEFRIRLTSIRKGHVILCVRYVVDGKELWDNNGGNNYEVEFERVRDDMMDLRKKLEGVAKNVETPRKHLRVWLSNEADDDDDDDDAPPRRVNSRSPSPPKDALRDPATPLSARYDFGKSLKGAAWPSPPHSSPPVSSPRLRLRSPSPPPGQRARHHARSAPEIGPNPGGTPSVRITPVTGTTPPPFATDDESSSPSISPLTPAGVLPSEMPTPTPSTYHAFLDQFCFFTGPPSDGTTPKRAHSTSSVEDYFTSTSPPLGRTPMAMAAEFSRHGAARAVKGELSSS